MWVDGLTDIVWIDLLADNNKKSTVSLLYLAERMIITVAVPLQMSSARISPSIQSRRLTRFLISVH